MQMHHKYIAHKKKYYPRPKKENDVRNKAKILVDWGAKCIINQLFGSLLLLSFSSP